MQGVHLHQHLFTKHWVAASMLC